MGLYYNTHGDAIFSFSTGFLYISRRGVALANVSFQSMSLNVFIHSTCASAIQLTVVVNANMYLFSIR